MRSCDIVRLLRAKFAPPAWAFLTEVANGTGGHKSRTADAIAMSVWPSRGLELHGIEVKISRSDWKRELENPAKAEAVCQFCDRWWVAAYEGVVMTGELPPTWGLIEAAGGKLRTAVQAPKLEAKPVTRTFLAELLRKSCEQSAEKAALDERYQAGLKAGCDESAYLTNRAKEDLACLQKAVDDFQAVSGVRINAWNGNRIGEAVKRVLHGPTPKDVMHRLLDDTGKLRAILTDMLNSEGP